MYYICILYVYTICIYAFIYICTQTTHMRHCETMITFIIIIIIITTIYISNGYILGQCMI